MRLRSMPSRTGDSGEERMGVGVSSKASLCNSKASATTDFVRSGPVYCQYQSQPGTDKSNESHWGPSGGDDKGRAKAGDT